MRGVHEHDAGSQQLEYASITSRCSGPPCVTLTSSVTKGFALFREIRSSVLRQKYGLEVYAVVIETSESEGDETPSIGAIRRRR